VEPLHNGQFGATYFCNFLQQYRSFPLSEVKNVLVTPVEAKIFVLIMGFFYCVLNSEGLLRKVPIYSNTAIFSAAMQYNAADLGYRYIAYRKILTSASDNLNISMIQSGWLISDSTLILYIKK